MKNKKMLLFAGVLAAFLMLAVPFAVVSFDAEDVDASDSDVAKIGDTGYTTIQDAIDAAELGDTVVILTDVELTDKLIVAAGDKLIIDLNGHVISLGISEDATSNTELILNSGHLTINDTSVEKTGKITNIYTGANPDIVEGGVVVNGKATNTITAVGNSTLIINGGHIENKTEASTIAYAIDGRTNGGSGDVSVIINGGHISSEKQAVRIFANSTSNTGSLTITGGEFDGRIILHDANSQNNIASLTITGGEFNPSEVSPDSVYVYGQTIFDADVSISGGIFNGLVRSTLDMQFVSGGVFSSDVSAYCIDDFDISFKALDDCTLDFPTDVSGKITFTEEFESTEQVIINASGAIEIVGELGNRLGGLKVVNWSDVEVSISEICTGAYGIHVIKQSDVGKNHIAGSVKIEDCIVSYAGSVDVHGAIHVQRAESVIVEGCVVNGISEDAHEVYGIAIQDTLNTVLIKDNEVYDITGNAIWVQDRWNNVSEVTIEGNIVNNWDSDNDVKGGRAIRLSGRSYDDGPAVLTEVTVSGNTFSKTYPQSGDIDLGDIIKAQYVETLLFSENSMNGKSLSTINENTSDNYAEYIYVDCDTILGDDSGDPRGKITGTLYIFSLTIAEDASLDISMDDAPTSRALIIGNLSVYGEFNFTSLNLMEKGAYVYFAKGVGVSGRISTSDSSASFQNVVAGTNGLTLRHGSLEIEGGISSGPQESIIMVAGENVQLTGTLGAGIELWVATGTDPEIVGTYTIESGAKVVFFNGKDNFDTEGTAIYEAGAEVYKGNPSNPTEQELVKTYEEDTKLVDGTESDVYVFPTFGIQDESDKGLSMNDVVLYASVVIAIVVLLGLVYIVRKN